MDGGFDLIVLTWPPPAHAPARLPVDWNRHIRRRQGWADLPGPAAAIRIKAKYDRAIALLTNPAHALRVRVPSRAHGALRTSGLAPKCPDRVKSRADRQRALPGAQESPSSGAATIRQI
jgi:hypothetical protein